jgi:dolichol-phosphate mannosyltransferase
MDRDMIAPYLTAIPVYNEADSVLSVLREVQTYCPYILIVDDGSSDETPAQLEHLPHQSIGPPFQDWPRGRSNSNGIRHPVTVVRHPVNRGYGAALRSAFCFAIRHDYSWVITIDCDGQHEPQRIPNFLHVCQEDKVDIVSGSRYLDSFPDDSLAPADRREINTIITRELNERLGLRLTDAFCGFKAYRVSALKRLTLTEDGYAMPLQLWVQAAWFGLRIMELPVPRIYLDPRRSFGGGLDDAETRLSYYRSVIERSCRDLITESDLPELSLARCGNSDDRY